MPLSQRYSGDELLAATLLTISRLAASHVHVRAFAEAVFDHLAGAHGVTALSFSSDPALRFGRVPATMPISVPGARGPEGHGMVSLSPHATFDPRIWTMIGEAIGHAIAQLERLTRVAGTSRRAHRERVTLHRRVRELGGDAHFVTASEAMRDVARAIEIVATAPTTVLITGETGTGKELVARQIHALGRSDAPFVAVNSSAIPDELFESELFGHEVGAFTGASRKRRGRFELAGEGTLFLDEVGELSLPAQAKLLRVLQERVVEPLGAERSIAITCRVIVATHRDLGAMVDAGTFRADLYYRLAAYPIAIPPLRDRPTEIPSLVHAKLGVLAARLAREVPVVPDTVMRELVKRPYPGNVRELENVLEHALLTSGDVLALPRREPVLARRAPIRVATPQTFEASAREAIVTALEASRGKLYGAGGAAEKLGLHPSTLQTKMRRLGITRETFTGDARRRPRHRG